MAKGWNGYTSNALELFTPDLTLQQKKDKVRKMRNIIRNQKQYSSFDLLVETKAAEVFAERMNSFKAKSGCKQPSWDSVVAEVKKNMNSKQKKGFPQKKEN